jgi:hypothetical protein
VFAGSDEDELQEVISDIDEHAMDETAVAEADTDTVPPEQTPADAIKEALGLKKTEQEPIKKQVKKAPVAGSRFSIKVKKE